jgi:hypothetical protein
MLMIYIILLGLIVISMIVSAIVLLKNCKVFDTLLLRFMEVNQQFYINQGNLIKNQQYLLNKIEDNISRSSLIIKSVEKLESINKDLKNSISQIKLSNIKNVNLLKGVNHGEKVNEKPDHDREGNPKRIG